MIGARTLSRHLAVSAAAHRTTFSAYEAELRPYVAENQAKPRGRAGLRRRTDGLSHGVPAWARAALPAHAETPSDLH
ncbi:hypothetical protein ACFYPK_16800 [Streptomyces halstedii]|uniref:hypothetical protein n=1 Tax=Streptomyces TaxID=1883 RepID=UPI0012FF4221|nr:hypothetical protein [Streptomyces sp. NTK 937]